MKNIEDISNLFHFPKRNNSHSSNILVKSDNRKYIRIAILMSCLFIGLTNVKAQVYERITMSDTPDVGMCTILHRVCWPTFLDVPIDVSNGSKDGEDFIKTCTIRDYNYGPGTFNVITNCVEVYVVSLRCFGDLDGDCEESITIDLGDVEIYNGDAVPAGCGLNNIQISEVKCVDNQVVAILNIPTSNDLMRCYDVTWSGGTAQGNYGVDLNLTLPSTGDGSLILINIEDCFDPLCRILMPIEVPDACFDPCENQEMYELCSNGTTSITLTAEGDFTSITWYNGSMQEIGNEVSVIVDSNTLGLGDGAEIFYYRGRDLDGCAIALCCPIPIILIECCQFTATATTACNNNNTPFEVSDDTFTFILVVDGPVGEGYTFSGDSSGSGQFQQSEGPFGSFPISSGDIVITINGGPCGTSELNIQAPEVCSDICPENCFNVTVSPN